MKSKIDREDGAQIRRKTQENQVCYVFDEGANFFGSTLYQPKCLQKMLLNVGQTPKGKRKQKRTWWLRRRRWRRAQQNCADELKGQVRPICGILCFAIISHRCSHVFISCRHFGLYVWKKSSNRLEHFCFVRAWLSSLIRVGIFSF